MIRSIIAVLAVSGYIYGQNGADLAKAKCASCHLTEPPTFEQMGSLSAPPFDAVIFHLKGEIKDREKQKAFIVDYVFEPSAKKSVCESHKVRKFGVMPSMKGKVSTKELEAIADFLLDNYPHEKFVTLITTMQTNDKVRALEHSPFLINDPRLPHLTKRLLHNWDKAKLSLSDKQKKALLKVRQETLSKIKEIKYKLSDLEEDILDTVMEQEENADTQKTLETIAKLKIEASKIHLECISKTAKILSTDQMRVLWPQWEGE